jgi:hypothetical protein
MDQAFFAEGSTGNFEEYLFIVTIPSIEKCEFERKE